MLCGLPMQQVACVGCAFKHFRDGMRLLHTASTRLWGVHSWWPACSWNDTSVCICTAILCVDRLACCQHSIFQKQLHSNFPGTHSFCGLHAAGMGIGMCKATQFNKLN